MAAAMRVNAVGKLRWVVISGERREVFSALGHLASQEIHEVVDGLPELSALAAYSRTSQGRREIDALAALTLAAHPTPYAELAALAEGAGIDLSVLLLANLRGDLGWRDSMGCTDVGWRRERSLMAHNEDGAPTLASRLMLVTLKIDGDAPVAALWYPGFLPSNTFTATGNGLVWGINSLETRNPGPGAGRQFVARGLQQVESFDAAINFLASHPSAGGFAYNIGEVSSGRVATVEATAGRVAIVEADPTQLPSLWHTNHVRYLAEEPHTEQNSVVMESLARGHVVDALAIPADGPSLAGLLDFLTTPSPNGAFRSSRGGDPLSTLCSTAVDLDEGVVVFQPREGARIRMALSDLTHGGPIEQSAPG